MGKLLILTSILLGITVYAQNDVQITPKQPVEDTAQNNEILVENTIADLYFCVKASEQKIEKDLGPSMDQNNTGESEDPNQAIIDGLFAGLDCDKTIERIHELNISRIRIADTVKKAIKDVAVDEYIQCKKENYLSDEDSCDLELSKAKSYGATIEGIKEVAGDLASLLNL